MTRYTYETACALFDKYGYSDTCEFVRISDTKRGRFLARCKTCGYEFERDNNILRKPQKKLRCPECHDKLVTAVVEYYQAGHSRFECADKFGIDHGQVMYYAKIRGVSGGMSKEKQGEYARIAQKKASARSAEIARERAEVRNNDKRIRKEWRDLNDDIEQWRKALDMYELFKKDFSSERARFSNWVSGCYYPYKTRLIEFEPQVATCKHCGKKWLFWPTRKKYAHHKPPTFCSDRCYTNHHYNREASNHRHRAHKYGVAYESGITLKNTEKRDKGICYLCGGKTSRNDRWTTENGYSVIGQLYPTQDHVIPMVRGGGHVSDNVKLAHKRCNELKGDKLLSELSLPFSIPIRALRS